MTSGDGLPRRLEEWVSARADGDWEHSRGIVIETLDNAGWSLVADVNGTGLERVPFQRVEEERRERDWFTCRVEAGVFRGAGGPANLGDIVREFLGWAGASPNQWRVDLWAARPRSARGP